MPLQIAVVGASACDEETLKTAYEVGREIAKAGAVLICGGLGGVMEAACQGAKQAGGLTIGIIPGPQRGSANPYVDYEIVTNAGHARNVFIAHSADALIAISGEYGTLSEIAIGLKLGKPVAALGSWNIQGMIRAKDPESALRSIMEKVR